MPSYSPEANINIGANGRPLLRQLDYLSPSSLKDFESDPDRFYLERIAPVRQERYPQTEAMAVGSAFDAYIKARLAQLFKNKLTNEFGEPLESDMFDYDDCGVPVMLFKSVEEQNWNFAVNAGKVVFEAYKQSYACKDLGARLHKARSLHMESTCQKVIEIDGIGVPILGKPDLAYIDEQGRRIILDWKVNGFCGTSTTRPVAGHIAHKKAVLMDCLGFIHNVDMPKGFKAYKEQLTTYDWLLGGDPREKLYGAIDQLVCNETYATKSILTYQHRYIIDDGMGLYRRYQSAWEVLNDYDLAVEYFGDIVNVPTDIAIER
jgi:hypothetical protein